MSIEQHTAPATHAHGNPISLPVRVSGRSLIDNDGRVVGKRGEVMLSDGYIDTDYVNGFTAISATDCVHQLAHAVNNAQRLAEALQYVMTCVSCCGALEGAARENALAALAAWEGNQ